MPPPAESLPFTQRICRGVNAGADSGCGAGSSVAQREREMAMLGRMRRLANDVDDSPDSLGQQGDKAGGRVLGQYRRSRRAPTLRLKKIADAGLRDQLAWVRGLWFEFLAQLREVEA